MFKSIVSPIRKSINPHCKDGSAGIGTHEQRDTAEPISPVWYSCCVWMPYNGCAVPLSSCPYMEFYLEKAAGLQRNPTASKCMYI